MEYCEVQCLRKLIVKLILGSERSLSWNEDVSVLLSSKLMFIEKSM